MYRAFVVNKTADAFEAGLQDLDPSQLPDGDVTIRTAWSSLNYKDGLATLPNGGVIRSYPMVPGIDLAGTVESSTDPAFQPGQQVFVTGYGTGVAHPGGFAEMARMPAAWTLSVPAGLSPRETMLIGTAGFTAALSVDALLHHGLTPDRGTVLVTGATGGVGSVAVDLLSRLGFTVAASTGKPEQAGWLKDLGASEILAREDVDTGSTRPLEKERWAGAVDPVGGSTTAGILRTTRYFGAVAVSGLTGGSALDTTVMPFILRGVSLLGIDSVMQPMATRRRLWDLLAGEWKPERFLALGASREITLDDIPAAAQDILAGRIRGRVLVRLGQEA